MKKHSFLSIFLILALAFISNSVWAESRLPNQPVGADGYYIVKWDCEKNTWAESNDMEYDETFVLAIDLTGTPYENWVKNAQTRNGVTYPVDNTIVSLNTFLGDKGNMYTDNRARLWHIRDNIYGAMYNFAQFNMNNGQPNPTPTIGAQTKIYTRIFPSATLFSDHCYPIEPSASHKKGSVWDYQDTWYSKTDNQPFFVFAPYTGTKTGADFSTEEMTPGTYIFYDNNHYVVSNGYAAPCSVNNYECCPFFYPLDPVTQTVPVGADTTLVAEERSGNMTGAVYQWFRYKTSDGEASATPYTGTGATTKTCHPATDVNKSDYTYYCFITTDNCPDGVYTTKAQVKIYSCTLDESKFAITPDKIGKYIEGSQVVLTAQYAVSSTDTRTFSWSKDGLPITNGTDYTIQKVDNNTCKLTINAATDDLAGEYTCTVQEGDVADCKVATTYTLELKHCPDYTITIDGVQVTTAPTFYPGGWYKIACTSTAGNPTAMVLAAGAKAKFGHDTLYIDADATTAPLTIEFPTAETADYAPCSGTLAGLISKCGEDEAYVIKWDDNKGYVVDNNGVVQMSTSVNDNTADRWLALPEGTQALGKDVVYLYNLKTNRYLYHGPVQTADDGPGDYSQALTSATLGTGNEYKWILYQGDQQRIYIMNLSNGTNNWEQDALVLHCRDWDYMYCQGNNNQYDIRVCKPDMKVGKMRGYTVSGDMHSSVNNLKKVTGTPVHFTTAVDWNGTAPSATVEMNQGEDITFTAKRTDDLHSINHKITYSSSATAVATVDAATGKVTAVASGTATITAKLEDAGCFDGAELTYKVHIKGCSPFTWSIDKEPGLSKLIYPGGWYMIHCTNEDGAPDITVSGTGITSETPTKNGNTTSVKVIVTGNAVVGSDITLKASLSGTGMTCEDTQTVTVAECTETSAESRKIEWFNFKTDTQEFPQYWIHDGASVFLRDNNGVLEADIEHQDGLDQWYIIYTGEMCQGQKVFYLQNVQTMRYVYRGSVHGNQGGDWEYVEALLSENNLRTDDFKWVLYAHGNDTAVVNIGGFTGSNLTNGAYVLHVRNWEAPGLFSNPYIPSPHMVCGKMANQGGSPAFYFKNYTTTKPITQFQTSVAWQGTAPADTITSQQGNQFGYTIARTDTIHSINKAITYRSTNTSVATVDATTGQVTVMAADGECDIEAILETVGCFNGDTLRYHVRLYDCTRDITTHNDYLLPKQPKADDCSYIVKWDCATGTWATENDMEWGETFVFAINLAGTPLGDWVMQGSGRAGVVRSVAFDRFQGKHDPNVDNIGQQLNLDASRLWHIRDTIFGATFNFSQIPFNDSPTHFYTPAMGEQTEISARLFGFETAVGEACNKTFTAPAGKWWEWSNVGSTQSQWKGQWLENSYVSGNDMYLFRFAPYTGKSDPEIKAADDDSRDQWYDNHYFDRKGYHSPCPQAWPIDQTLSLDTTFICQEEAETATLTMATSEIDCSYQLYKDGTAIGGTQAGTGSALTWTITEAGTYTVMAISPIEGHDAWMGLCNGTKEQEVSNECQIVTYLKFDDNNGTHVWSDIKNWWPTYTRLPNDTDSAVIVMPCQVDIPTARTYYLTFEVTSGYDITVLPTGGLTITGEITNAQQGDILIQSTAAGNGSFVYKNPATPYPAKVEFYSPAKDGDKLNPTWQYAGQPLAANINYGDTYTQPGTQIYIWDAMSDHSMGGLWYRVDNAYNFAPFRGFCLTQATPATYTYEGNLNAATAQTLAVPYLDATDYPSFYLLSNSWTAPIRIADLETSDFNYVDATVYIMNTGTYQEALAQQSNQSATGQAKLKGQYNAIPVHAAPYMADALQVIPSMQGFFVHNSTGDQAGSVTIDYEKAVYSTTYTLSNEPARAPRRMGNADAIQTMHLTVENLYWADAVDLLDGTQFTDGFDQGWDGRKMPGKDVNISLSVRTAGGEMSVAAMSDWTMVPLTLHNVHGLEYTFRATMQQESNLYLYDKDNNTYTALTDGAEYTFRTNRNVESDRFYICKGWQKAQEETGNDIDGKYIINGHLIIIRNGVMHTALGMQLK